MGYRIPRKLASYGLYLSVLSASSFFALPQAQAQEDEVLAEARSKFQRALELEQAANYAGALKLYREVGFVKMTPQVRYHIALCEEKLGQLVAALGGYELAMSMGSDMPEAFINEVQTSIDELRAQIPKLVIERGSGAEAAAIELDGVALGDSSIGVEIPLNPGPHSIVAESPGYEKFQTTVTVREGTSESLQVVLEVLPEPVAPPPPPPPVDSGPRFGVIPYVIGGSGLGVVVAGGVLLGFSQTKVSKIKKICGGTDCSRVGADDKSEARRLEKSAVGIETAGWVSIGAGLLATGTGVLLYYLDRKKPEETSFGGRHFRVLPVVSHQTWGLHLASEF